MGGATALRHNGDVFNTENIGSQLATRDLMADLRAADPLLTGAGEQGGPAFSKQDRVTVSGASRGLDPQELIALKCPLSSGFQHRPSSNWHILRNRAPISFSRKTDGGRVGQTFRWKILLF